MSLRSRIVEDLRSSHPRAITSVNDKMHPLDSGCKTSLAVVEMDVFYQRIEVLLQLADSLSVNLAAVPSYGDAYTEKIKCIDLHFAEVTFQWDYNMVTCVSGLPVEVMNKLLFAINQNNESQWNFLPIRLVRSTVVPKFVPQSSNDMQVHLSFSGYYCVIYYIAVTHKCTCFYAGIRVNPDVDDDDDDDLCVQEDDMDVESVGKDLSTEEKLEIFDLCKYRYKVDQCYLIKMQNSSVTRKWSGV